MGYKPWNKKEIENYQRNFIKSELGPAYLSAGISACEPHKRVEYLIEKLNLTETKKKEIINKLESPDESGIEKSSILSSLEKRAMNTFGIRQQFFENE
ncbi:MAG: hypothetical protein Q8O84_03755 [Nanoarchaeota archaeon]|nr:hypothetical protein [Nanoarchaeota archaeon]